MDINRDKSYPENSDEQRKFAGRASPPLDTSLGLLRYMKCLGINAG